MLIHQFCVTIGNFVLLALSPRYAHASTKSVSSRGPGRQTHTMPSMTLRSLRVTVCDIARCVRTPSTTTQVCVTALPAMVTRYLSDGAA